MLVCVSLLPLLLAGLTLAHPDHSDELDEEATRALYERHKLATRRCSNSLRARQAPALQRLHARRAAILAGQEKPSLILPRQTTTNSTGAFNGTAGPGGNFTGMPGNMTGGGGGMGGGST